MGQRENSNRGASLDDEKRRGAGRAEQNPEAEAIKDFQKPVPAKGAAGGAFGAEGQANRGGGAFTQGGGGGGGAPSTAGANHLNTGTKSTGSTTPDRSADEKGQGSGAKD